MLHELVILNDDLDSIIRAGAHATATPPAVVTDHGLVTLHFNGVENAHILGTCPAAFAAVSHSDLDPGHPGVFLAEQGMTVSQSPGDTAAGTTVTYCKELIPRTYLQPDGIQLAPPH